jgi:2,3-bisphosphoglycerate-independent phosphoglycerate mutase
MSASDYDFGFIHIKAVDDCGHDKNVSLKIEFLEKIDAMVGTILQRIREHGKDAQVSQDTKLADTVILLFQIF